MRVYLAPSIPEVVGRELAHGFRRYRGMGRTWTIALMRRPQVVTDDGERVPHDIREAVFSVERHEDGWLFTPTVETAPLLEAFAREIG